MSGAGHVGCHTSGAKKSVSLLVKPLSPLILKRSANRKWTVLPSTSSPSNSQFTATWTPRATTVVTVACLTNPLADHPT